MEAKELETLFKLLRGSDKFSNVTFVCAFDRTEVCKILQVTRPHQNLSSYIEKFFPVGFPLPEIGSEQLRDFFIERMKKVLVRTGSPEGENELTASVRNNWAASIGPYFGNLRKIKVFFNRINRSLELIANEVNVLDFIKLELIRDVAPALYGFVFRNPEYFWERLGFENWSRGAEPVDENAARNWRGSRYKQIEESLSTERRMALDLLAELFPSYDSYRKNWKAKPDLSEAEKNRRIFHPRYFWQYFLLKVPSELYSQADFAAFLASLRNCDEEEAAIAYGRVFQSLISEDYKRYYFMHLIEMKFDTLNETTQRGLCRGMAKNSSLWPTDAFELSIAITCVQTTMEKTEDAGKRQQLLRDIIQESSSDLFSLVLFWRLKKTYEERAQKGLGADVENMRSLLTQQLRAHYLQPNPPSVFEQYGASVFGSGRIEPNQFLFSWQALGDQSTSDAREYLQTLFKSRPQDLREFLNLMFRVDFIDDYTTLKPLFDYRDLAELIAANEKDLDPRKVQRFRERYNAESQSIEAADGAVANDTQDTAGRPMN